MRYSIDTYSSFILHTSPTDTINVQYRCSPNVKRSASDSSDGRNKFDEFGVILSFEPFGGLAVVGLAAGGGKEGVCGFIGV